MERGHVARRQPNQLGRAMLSGSQNTGGTVEVVHPLFDRTLPQALPEASSGVSPSQMLLCQGCTLESHPPHLG